MRLVTLLLLLSTTAASAGPSGLPWSSGASSASACLAQLRGRPHDADSVWLTHVSFPLLVKNTGNLLNVMKLTPILVAGTPLLTTDHAGAAGYAACAAGSFDTYYRQMGVGFARSAAANPAGEIVVRLGWEANIGSGSHPWGVDSNAGLPNYRNCFRRAAQAIKAGHANVLIEQTWAKTPHLNVAQMYAGDDVVDIVGFHYYDSGPTKSTQAIWDKYAGQKAADGSPMGIDAWTAFARSHNKPYAVAEWGVWRKGTQTIAQTDDSVYIDNMARYFAANASGLVYETYFNADPSSEGGDNHALCGGTHDPSLFVKATAAYVRGWGG